MGGAHRQAGQAVVVVVAGFSLAPSPQPTAHSLTTGSHQ